MASQEWKTHSSNVKPNYMAMARGELATSKEKSYKFNRFGNLLRCCQCFYNIHEETGGLIYCLVAVLLLVCILHCGVFVCSFSHAWTSCLNICIN